MHTYFNRLLIFLALALLTATSAGAQMKREFRGAWIQCVNGQFQGMSPEAMRQTLSRQLDVLRADGCNAIIFQVRPECDALYESGIEPWSRFLTGRQGAAPSPRWDPLAWMIAECHRRGMELHAWINPYRAKTKGTTALAPNHVALRHPERVFSYDSQLILNPALKENRDYICDVVRDIVTRYDVDGLHIDDYFYPYPAAGQTIPDARDFAAANNGIRNISDWRRYNVSLFVEQLSRTIHKAKPWVKFGISPFGIYRNKKSDPVNGSETNGLQNYDDLYADVLLWVNNGWLDYCVPQVYWQIGHPAADYQTLITWWARHAAARPLFIGEDVERTVKYPDPKDARQHQMAAKMALHRQNPAVGGTVLWYAKAAVDDIGSYGTLLRTNYWRTPALQPAMPFLSKKSPAKVKGMKVLQMGGDRVLFWTAPKGKGWETEATAYAVYAFPKGTKATTDDSRYLMAITRETFYKLPATATGTAYTYLVTALNRIHNESKATKRKVKM